MGATWITVSGRHKIEVVSTVDRGQYLTVEEWSGRAWVLRGVIPPPRAARAETVGDALVEALRDFLDPAELVEAPSQDDAWDTDPDGSAARWIPDEVTRAR